MSFLSGELPKIEIDLKQLNALQPDSDGMIFAPRLEKSNVDLTSSFGFEFFNP